MKHRIWLFALLLIPFYSGQRVVLSPSAVHATSYPLVTTSYYEPNTDTTKLYTQGCAAGHANATGYVFLDFGRPAAIRSGLTITYGTIDYENKFVSDSLIAAATQAYADGYWNCSPVHTTSYLTIAMSTNNSCGDSTKCGNVPPDFTYAGQLWQFFEHQVSEYIISKSHNTQEFVIGGGDWEPGFDPSFTHTGNFIYGYSLPPTPMSAPYPMVNFGSMEPGFWNQDQEVYVAWCGFSNMMLPEIYIDGQAKEWKDLAVYARHEGLIFSFLGVTSTPYPGYYTPHQAADTLLTKLQSDPLTYRDAMNNITTITYIP